MCFFLFVEFKDCSDEVIADIGILPLGPWIFAYFAILNALVERRDGTLSEYNETFILAIFFETGLDYEGFIVDVSIFIVFFCETLL